MAIIKKKLNGIGCLLIICLIIAISACRQDDGNQVVESRGTTNLSSSSTYEDLTEGNNSKITDSLNSTKMQNNKHTQSASSMSSTVTKLDTESTGSSNTDIATGEIQTKLPVGFAPGDY